MAMAENDPRLNDGGLSPDLTGLASEYGIDVSGAQAGTYAGGTDYPILVSPPVPGVGGDPVRVREGASGGQEVIVRGGKEKVGGRTRLASDVLRDFYRLDGEELRALKRRLYQAGFYPRGTKLSDIDNPEHDDVSFAAYQSAVERAGSFFEAGRDVTLDQVLDTPSHRIAAGLDDGTGMSPIVKQELVQQVARELIGQKLPEVEAAQIAQRIGSDDREEAAILAERAIRGGPHATEAGATDFIKISKEFYGMLGGNVPSPSGPPTQGPF